MSTFCSNRRCVLLEPAVCSARLADSSHLPRRASPQALRSRLEDAPLEQVMALVAVSSVPSDDWRNLTKPLTSGRCASRAGHGSGGRFVSSVRRLTKLDETAHVWKMRLSSRSWHWCAASRRGAELAAPDERSNHWSSVDIRGRGRGAEPAAPAQPSCITSALRRATSLTTSD